MTENNDTLAVSLHIYLETMRVIIKQFHTQKELIK